MTEERKITMHLRRDAADRETPLDMRQRYFRLAEPIVEDALFESLDEIRALPIGPSVEFLPGEGHVEIGVRLASGVQWHEGGRVTNTEFILGSLQRATGGVQ